MIFCAFCHNISDSVHSDVSPDFFGALDDQQLLVVEGSLARLFVILCQLLDRISLTRV